MTTSQAKSQEAAARFLLPSVRDIIFIFLFCSLLTGTLSNRPLADPDIGWHIRTGEQILIAHALPRTDPYSSLMQGQAWFAWEWLYDLALGILHHFCGLNGVVWLCAVLVASTFTLLLSQLLKQGTSLFLAIALMLLAECAAVIHLFARPHIVSWLFVLLWFIALERWEQGSAARWLPWFFPLSMLLWANLHAGWILGLMLLSIYILAAFADSWRSQDPFDAVRTAHRTRRMAWSWAAAVLASFVNPFGWRLHAHIYRYLSDRYLIDRISEFRSPNFHYWPPRCFAIIVVLVLIAFAGHVRRIRFSHLLITLLAVYTGLFSSRNLPVSSMLLVLVTGPLLWESFERLSDRPGARIWMRARTARIADFSGRMGTQELQLRGHLWPVLCVIGGLALCLHGGKLGSRALVHAQFDPKSVPVAATDFLEKEPSAEPVFSIDTWGGYLIYRLYPRRQVVVDDRHDLYGSDRVRQLLTLTQGEPGWRSTLDTWQVHTALLPANSTLASLLRQLPEGWAVKDEDQVAVVFERRVR
jgi:hypothetical protein